MAFNNAINAKQTGFQALSSTGVWAGRTMQAGAGMMVTNGDGVAGDPVFSVTGSGAPGADWTLIESITVNNQASIAFSTNLTNYQELYVSMIDIVTNGNDLMLFRVSTDGGSTFVTGQNSGARIAAGTTVSSFGTALEIAMINISTNPTSNGWFLLNNRNLTIPRTLQYYINNPTGNDGTVGDGIFYPAAQINFVEIFRNANAWTTGTVNIYGRNPGPAATSTTQVDTDFVGSTYVVQDDDQYLMCFVNSGNLAIQLPDAPSDGRSIVVRNFGVAPGSTLSVTTVSGTVQILSSSSTGPYPTSFDMTTPWGTTLTFTFTTSIYGTFYMVS